MKKLFCILLSVLMLSAVLVLASCEISVTFTKYLKYGVGISVETSATDATEDKNGTGEADSTIALITVDDDGKVVDCKIDVAQIKAAYTADGKAVATTDFRTKAEKGNDYGMSRTGKTEWYAQAEAFEKVVVGKTLSEIKALVVDGDKGTDEVITAGCTISVNEFVKAIEKAFNNLDDFEVPENYSLKIGTATEQTLTDYDAETEKDGTNEIDTTIFAAIVDADGKVVAVDIDCTQVRFTFDGTGKSTFTATEVLTKRQKGNDYGMSRTGKTEWYAQADAFETLCIGKTASEITKLAVDGKGTEAVQTAGCTIGVEGFVEAAAKIG